MKAHSADLLQDVRICVRGLMRVPLMTFTILATVGLGIGATTVIFSAIHAALLRPLPYKNPDQIFRLYTDAPPNKFRFSMADYLALQDQQTHFEQIASYTGRAVAFTDGSTAERVTGREVSWTYFALLGITPVVGRDFTEKDGREGEPRTVIVSDGFWKRRLGGTPDAIGKPIRLDGADYVVAGVLPQTAGPLEQQQEFFIAGQYRTPPRKGPFFYTVIARLKSGEDAAAAATELHAINRRIFPLWKSSYQDDKATWSMMSLKTFVVGDVRTVAGLSLAAVGLVWLIACANASNLLIARVTSRRRELAVRAALGATRGRVLRYLLAESCLLALGSASLGIMLASFGVRFLRDYGAGYFPRIQEIALDGPVMLVLVAVTAASMLLFGLVPALQGSGGSLDESLRTSGRATGSVGSRRLRQVLVASQFAVATPLLVVAGLLLASLNELGRIDLGFDSHNVLTASIQLPAAQYQESGRVSSLWDELKRGVAALPGVSTVSFSDGRPPNDVGNFNNFELEEFPTSSGQSQPVTPWVAVSPEYFGVLGLPLIEGRLLDERDAQTENLESVVVDRAWAKRFFPAGSAVGKRFKEGGCTACPWTSVVGVVSTVKYAGLDTPDNGTVYTSVSPSARFRNIVIRTSADPSTVLPMAAQVLRTLDPTVPLSSAATIDELVALSLQRPRSLSWLVGILAAVALVLAMLGIHGVMSFYVQQHTKDISIRLALGGTPAGVLRLIVGQGMRIVSGGILVGLLGALFLTRWLSSLLFGVRATDSFTFLAVSVTLLIVAVVACLVPARRAIAVQPAVVLRD